MSAKEAPVVFDSKGKSPIGDVALFEIKQIGTEQGRPLRPEVRAFVEASSWFEARALAFAKFGACAGGLVVELVRDASGVVVDRLVPAALLEVVRENYVHLY